MAEREIKTILTLEDASFSKGLKAATSNVAAIRAEMNAAVAGASGIGKGLKKWSAQTTGLSKALKAQKQQMGVLNKEYKNQNDRLKEAAKALKKATQENGEGSEEAKKAANAYAAQSAQVNDLRIKMANLSTQISRDKSKLQENLAKPLKAVGAAAKTMGIAMAAGMLTAGTALIALGKQSLESRQQLNADISASRATFEAWSGLIEQDASNAWKNLGLSKDAYLAEAVTIGEYLQSAGLPVRESASLTEQVLQRAADLAGVYGTDTASAMKAVEQAARGNYREMNRYGVKLTSNTIKQWALDKGLIATGKDLTKEEEAAYAVQMILEKTASAAGGFATRTDNVNSALETASAAWQDFISGSGSAENVVTAFAGAAKAVGDETLNLIPQMVGGVTSLVQGFVEALPGMLEEAGPTLNLLLTGILSALTDNAEAIGTAAGTLIGTLAASLIANAPTMVSAAWSSAGSFLTGFKTEFSSKWKKTIWPAIKKFFKATLGIELPDWETIQQKISDGWATVSGAVGEIFRAVFGVDPPASWEDVKTMLSQGWATVSGAVGEIFTAVFGVDPPASWEDVKTMLSQGWATVSGAVGDIFRAVFGVDPPASWEDVKTMLSQGWATISDKVGKIFRVVFGVDVPKSGKEAVALINGFWTKNIRPLVNGIYRVVFGVDLPENWDDLKNQITSINWTDVGLSIKNAAADLATFFAPLLSWQAYQKGKDFVSSLAKTFGVTKTNIEKAGGGIQGFFGALDWKGVAFSAALTGLVYLVTHWKEVCDWINQAIKDIKIFLGLQESDAQAFFNAERERLNKASSDEIYNALADSEDAVDGLKSAIVNIRGLMQDGSVEALGYALDALRDVPREQLSQYLSRNTLDALDVASPELDPGGVANLLQDVMREFDQKIMQTNADNAINQLGEAAEAGAEAVGSFIESLNNMPGGTYDGKGNGGGKFAGGLWSVPWDNYMARLHSGEMVLTADEARRYRAQTAAGGTVYNDTASIYIDKYNQYSGEDANALLQQMQLLQRRQRMGYGLS